MSGLRRSSRDKKPAEVTTFDSKGNITRRQSGGADEMNEASTDTSDEEEERHSKAIISESDDESIDLPDLSKSGSKSKKSIGRTSDVGTKKKRTMKDVGDAEEQKSQPPTKMKTTTKATTIASASGNYIFGKHSIHFHVFDDISSCDL